MLNTLLTFVFEYCNTGASRRRRLVLVTTAPEYLAAFCTPLNSRNLVPTLLALFRAADTQTMQQLRSSRGTQQVFASSEYNSNNEL